MGWTGRTGITPVKVMEATLRGRLPFGEESILAKIEHPLPLPETCPECRSDWVELVSNAEIYGRPYGKWPIVWLCRECDSSVGCHPFTNIPTGSLANKRTRQLRAQAHQAFDQLWQTASYWRMSRSQAYKFLCKVMRKQTNEGHIGMFSQDECQKLVSIVEEFIASKEKINAGK